MDGVIKKFNVRKSIVFIESGRKVPLATSQGGYVTYDSGRNVEENFKGTLIFNITANSKSHKIFDVCMFVPLH